MNSTVVTVLCHSCIGGGGKRILGAVHPLGTMSVSLCLSFLVFSTGHRDKRHVEMTDWKFVGNVCFVKLYYLCLYETTSECFLNETERLRYSQVVNKSNLLS